VERIGRSGGLILAVDSWVEFIPSCLGMTGLTGVPYEFDRCKSLWVLPRVNYWLAW
jgi:hypothetical protein